MELKPIQRKDTPRITLFLSNLGGGGAERVMLNLASGITQQGIDVDLVLGQAWGPHLQKVPSTVRLIDLKAAGFLAKSFALAKYLKQEQPFALISAMHYGNEIALWAKRLAKVPTQVIVTEHNTISQAIRQTTRMRKLLIPLFVRYVYPWADSIVTVSQAAAKDLAHFTGQPQERIQAIYNPVVSPELLEKAAQPLDHPWFLPGEPPVILGVGKLEAQKDFPNLIRAFAQARLVKPMRLVILGWGPHRSQLEALIAELGLEKDVALLGYVNNPYAYMARAAVFVLSSAWEGLPTVLIEAMAVGVPVISTNCKSGPAEILDHGQYGWLIPVGNSSALAEAILEALSSPRKKVTSSWLDQFSLESATQQYLNLLGLEKVTH
ncbi:glycosyl transferase group 1 [Halothece sp. PCC 7418]|uniref:glycosyltransferase n=1 Tax=Halothece sp. (strain PCC 7418) TaxID=65093 RepID=UPI0002A08CEA|nr:glycosyltransferase [Halothece sp. PCC 7418]AFZ44040.1 glycosyl transferase group 1 [Halothece sp. PCC 7418]